MLEQERLIERVREVAAQDHRLQAVLLYGSFAYGEGDSHSDVDFFLFFLDEERDHIDRKAWLQQIAPVEFHYRNDGGIDTVIFKNLIRGEFHFDKSSTMNQIDLWEGWFPSLESCVVLDRTGELTRHLTRLIRRAPEYKDRESAQQITDTLINWMVMGLHLLERGELARAYAFQSLLHHYLLKLIRLSEGSTTHWVNPGRRLEQEISNESYERYRQCAASFDPSDLRRAFRSTWGWAHELIEIVGDRFGTIASEDLLREIDGRFAVLQSDQDTSPAGGR